MSSNYSVVFCVQEGFEIEQAHELIGSIHHNTECDDINIVCPNPLSILEEFDYYGDVAIHMRANPIPADARCHKLPVFDIPTKNNKVIFVDTSTFFYDDIGSDLEDMEADIWANQIDMVKDFESDFFWRNICRDLEIRMPSKYNTLYEEGKTRMKTSSMIVLNNVRLFSHHWTWVAEELRKRSEFKEGWVRGNKKLRTIGQIALTLAIERMKLNHKTLPKEFLTAGVHKPDKNTKVRVYD